MLRRRFILRAMTTIPALAAARSAFADDSGVSGPASAPIITLEARNDWATVAGRPAYLSLFNGLLPGPAIRHGLPEDTNLHFHGLHVSPFWCIG